MSRFLKVVVFVVSIFSFINQMEAQVTDDQDLIATYREMQAEWVAGQDNAPLTQRIVAFLEEKANADPENMTARRLLAFEYLDQNEYEKVGALLSSLVKGAPSHPWVRILAARYLHLAKDETERPMQLFAMATESLPEGTETEKARKTNIVEEYALLIREHALKIIQEKPEEAFSFLKSALTLCDEAERLGGGGPNLSKARAWIAMHYCEFEMAVESATLAIEAWKDLDDKGPLVAALSIRGKSLTILGKYAEADADLTAALKFFPDDEELLQSAGFLDECVEFRNRAPCSGAIARAFTAADQYHGKDDLKVVRYTTYGLKDCPNHANALYERGVAYDRLKKFEEAKADLLRSIELSPQSVMPHAALGDVYVHIGDRESAVQEFQKVIDLAIENDEGLDAYSDVFVALGANYALLQKSEESLAAFKFAEMAGNLRGGLLYCDLAQQSLNCKKWQDATSYATKCLELYEKKEVTDERNSVMSQCLGVAIQAQLALNDFASAEQSARELTKIEDAPGVNIALVNALIQQKKLKEARELAPKMEGDLTDFSIITWGMRAEAWRALKRYDLAARDIRVVLQASPENTLSKMLLCFCVLQTEGKTPEALRILEELASKPVEGDDQVRMAILLAEVGRYDEAKIVIRKYISAQGEKKGLDARKVLTEIEAKQRQSIPQVSRSEVKNRVCKVRLLRKIVQRLRCR